jgi:hypothetical protein
MSTTKLFAVSLGLLMFCALLIPVARADEWNQATKITFTAPVEIPGKVLPAGTYWFKLLNDDPDRNVVQVWKFRSDAVTDYINHGAGLPSSINREDGHKIRGAAFFPARSS